MSACFGRSEDLVFSGATNGDIYIWRDTTLIKTIKAHDGPVFAMCSLDKVGLVSVLVLDFVLALLSVSVLVPVPWPPAPP